MNILFCVWLICTLVLVWYCCKYLAEHYTSKNLLIIVFCSIICLVFSASFSLLYDLNIRREKQIGFQEGLEQHWEYTIDTVWKHKKP